MKRCFLALFVSLALVPFGAATALELGRDYIRLPAAQPVETGDKIEVREFFWYGCPHCYAIEPAVERWLERKPANVEFVRTPGTAPRWLAHARAFYAFAALDATNETHTSLFRAIHEQKRPLDSEQALADFAKDQGVDPVKFRDAYNSFGVRTKVERAKQLNANFRVTSVPAFVVDGKYLTGPSMTRGEPGFIAALDQLVRKAAEERSAKAKR